MFLVESPLTLFQWLAVYAFSISLFRSQYFLDPSQVEWLITLLTEQLQIRLKVCSLGRADFSQVYAMVTDFFCIDTETPIPLAKHHKFSHLEFREELIHDLQSRVFEKGTVRSQNNGENLIGLICLKKSNLVFLFQLPVCPFDS